MAYYTIERENTKTWEKIILDKNETEELAISLNWNIRVVEAMVAWIPLARWDYHYSIVWWWWRMVQGIEEKEDIFYSQILKELSEKWILWELLWEWNDRIVYQHAQNPNLVIKVPKNTDAIRINMAEYETYSQESNLAIWLDKKYVTDWLARCVYDRSMKVLYMEKLHITEWSNFWVNPDWIIRRFDLNPII